MPLRRLVIALPLLAASSWFAVAGALSQGPPARQAASAMRQAELVNALAEVSSNLRSVQIELAAQAAGERGGATTSPSWTALGVSTNALQRVVGTDGPWTRQERVSIEELGNRLGEWGSTVADSGVAGAAGNPSPAAIAAPSLAVDLSAQTSDAITRFVTRLEGPAWVVRAAAEVERLDRAARAETGVQLSVLTALGTPPDSRIGAARDVGTARRAAALVMAGLVPGVGDRLRDDVVQLIDGSDDPLLSAFADDVTARSLTSSPASRLDAALERSSEWATLIRSAGKSMMVDASRASTAAQEAQRDAWALAAAALLMACGATVFVSGRIERLDTAHVGSDPSTTAPVPGPPPSETSDPAPSAEHASEAKPRTDSDREAVLACLVDYANTNARLIGTQIDLLDGLEFDARQHAGDVLGGVESRFGSRVADLDRTMTRLRRLSESILVLAGAEGDRRLDQPRSLADLVGLAVVEAAPRSGVEILGSADGEVEAGAAIDVAHLLAELLDDWACPGSGRITVKVQHSDADRMVVTLEQRLSEPSGFDPSQLADAIAGRHVPGGLGWMASGELARRHGIELAVDDRPGADARRVAVVLPRAILAGGSTAANDVSVDKECSMVWGWTAAGEYLPATGWKPDGDFVEPPRRLSDAVPTGDEFEAGLSSLLDGTKATSAGS